MIPTEQLIETARRKPLGDSWTYARPDEFAQQLIKLVAIECSNFVFQSEHLTVGQGYMLRKSIQQHFGIKE